MVIDVTVTGVSQSPEENWTQTGEFSYSNVYTTDQAVKVFDGDQLKLSVYVENTFDCDEVNIGNQTLYSNCAGTNFVFTCLYDLSDQVLTDDFAVSGVNVTTTTAQATGTINYDFIVDKNVDMGQKMTFAIVPKTPNIVFATVKNCSVRQDTNEVDIFGYGDKPMCYLEPTGAGWDNSPSSQETINGFWKAFQWYGDGLTTVESQSLVCTIGLSKEQNTQPVENCDL